MGLDRYIVDQTPLIESAAPVSASSVMPEELMQFQTLQLVMRMVGSELEALGRSLGGRLMWLEDPAHFGFPALGAATES